MSSVKNVLPIVQSQKILGQAVAYHPTIAKAFKSPEIALFICQFIYWCDEFEDEDCSISSWISKSATEIYNFTGITPDAQLTVRKKLKGLLVLSEKRIGQPATMHYQFDFNKVNEILSNGIPDTRKKRTDTQIKGKNGKFLAVSVNYGIKEIEPVSVNSSIPNLRNPVSVNYGIEIPKNTESLYNKNLSLDLNKSEKENFSNFEPSLQDNSSPTPIEEKNKIVEKISAKKENPAKTALKGACDISEVVDYLNQAAQKEFKSTTTQTQKLISGRITEGYTVQNFKDVIDLKVAEWKGDEKMDQYLQPSTLFNQSNFEKYHQGVVQLKNKKQNPNTSTFQNFNHNGTGHTVQPSAANHKGYRLTGAVDQYIESVQAERERQRVEFQRINGDALEELYNSL